MLIHSALLSPQSSYTDEISDMVFSGYSCGAFENLEQYGDALIDELKVARPELDIFFHVARITAALGDKDVAGDLLKFAYGRAPSRESKDRRN